MSANGRWWLALVTFERKEGNQEILPDHAQGAVGWMIALAPDGDTARELLVRDVEFWSLRVLNVTDVREIFDQDEIKEIDEHLAANFNEIEPGKQTVWGTIRLYKGDGEA